MLSSIMLATAAAELTIPPLLILPFILLLLSIAIIPLISPGWWGKFYSYVSVGLGAITLCYYLFVFKAPTPILHVLHEYISFIALIGSLFVVSGGVHISTRGQALPWMNCVFLLIGSILSNIVGTTGASMLLIRPWIRMNKRRISGFHIIFFIFIISNISGALTPIGDPPLFLGFLRGVSFWWTLEQCWLGWLVAILLVMAIFFVLDMRSYRKLPAEFHVPPGPDEKIKVSGLFNLVFLLIILVAVFQPTPYREILMILAAAGSYFITSKKAQKIYHDNEFNFHPIKEVAWLFIGIFLTMTPALAYLGAHADSFGIDTSAEFFWATGALSGFLDNAPTYLTFLATAMGLEGLDVSVKADVVEFMKTCPALLKAISMGAVFFGAMTYIGNGPNFMVKSIADQSHIKTPTFFGYLFKYSIPVLIPVFIVITILFFSKWAIF